MHRPPTRILRFHDPVQLKIDYRSRLLGWLLEEHFFVKRAILWKLPSVARLRLHVNERVVEMPFALDRLQGIGGRILDVGCADSAFPLMLAARGHDVVGFDIRPWSVPHPRFRFVRGDVRTLPFRDGTFAGVSMVSSLEHIGLGSFGDPRDARGDVAACREVMRVTAPGGRLILTVPYGRRATSDLQRVYDATGLADLLEGWTVRERRFYVREDGQWLAAGESVAARRESVPGTQAVALVVAER